MASKRITGGVTIANLVAQWGAIKLTSASVEPPKHAYRGQIGRRKHSQTQFGKLQVNTDKWDS